MKTGFFSILIFIVSSVSMAQIAGHVKDENGEGIPGISVVVEPLKTGVSTDINGKYMIVGLANGNYILSYSGVGYETQKTTINYEGRPLTVNINLKENVKELEGITITGKSESTIVREQAYAVEVIESKGFKNLTTNANDILGRVSGVNIRQSGGIGSKFSLSLNGISGNQVRVFLDGVPMDYFGSSLSLNNFSANLIDRIEVYKGVVPIHLSSDALGGAINVTTNGKSTSYLDASYSMGSFGTHLASLNTQYRNKKNGFTTRIKSFYNRSNNNYKVPVNLVNFETGKEEEEPVWVERFHDAYESKMVWAEAGFTGTKFADQLMVGVLYSDNYNELQQAANAIGQAKIPYGEVATEEEKIIANLAFNKRKLFTEKLSFNSYLVTVFSKSLSRDTASVRYDWYGNSTPKTDNATGEIENRKTLFELETENYLANANAEYQLNKYHSITLNYSLNHLTVQGADPYKNQNNTQFGEPNNVTKQVLAASYTNTLFDEKFKTTLFTKYYDYGLSSLETDYSGSEPSPFDVHKSNLGFGFSTTYKYDKWQLKASYEKATRFPEAIELFGDGLNTVASPSLTPEKSNNYNLGFLFGNKSAHSPFIVSVNGFVRDAENFIIPVVQGIKVYHINNSKVLSKGIDLSMGYTHREHWVLSVNGTYLDLRDNSKWRNGQVGVESSQYKVRLPNQPYLFGNASLSYRNEELFSNNDQYSISLSQNYVYEFFYKWENLASKNKDVVPTQYTTNMEFVYMFKEGRYNASFSVINLWNAKVYDNFQQLRPGRNFNFKLRYFLTKI
ncbi:TonB-dependent receptor [Reichenbachiella sp. MALMAid0571]|uniref:TonB-dependent receptor n=1 Tax=Reichenbachiella sp. MALMAid0571 TaxID=3143939 RepID=UPI0032DF98B4